MAYQRIAVLRPTIMRPFAVTARLDQSSPLQVSEMAGHFGLHYAESIG